MVFGVVYQFNEPDQTDSVFLLVGPFKVEFYWKVKA
jgi:hypothetical protein